MAKGRCGQGCSRAKVELMEPTKDPDEATLDVVRRWVRRGEARIDACHAGTRLDRYLAGRFTYRSRTQWCRLIAEGRITVNGHRVRPARTLRSGDIVAYVPLQRAEPEVDRAIGVLHVDEHLVAVAKSGNLPMHPSGAYFRNTLIHLLADTHPEWGALRVIHRLDRETSGIVVFGRTRAATESVAIQFRRRSVDKRYLAIVHGSPREDAFTIDAPLGIALDSQIRKAVGVRADGAAACTDVRVLHRGEGWAWVEARPRTGRLHQIRVHLRHAGLPILGDKVYGLSERFFLQFIADQPLTPAEQAALGLGRQALHAHRLTLRHPGTGALLDLRSPLPADMAGALRERGLDPAPWL
jgi:23S rRNA pseudouridine1911/1915/1917 synthase